MANLPPSNSVFMPTSDIVTTDSESLERQIRRLQMEREAIGARLSAFIPLNSGPTEIHRVLSRVSLTILGIYDSATPVRLGPVTRSRSVAHSQSGVGLTGGSFGGTLVLVVPVIITLVGDAPVPRYSLLARRRTAPALNT
ncbi:hypothetical protein B0H12DRAFT_1133806 [Mycena haematopus]|nr:hypothetical protein B0H12DRAFT_1133806 [Mycena haematopus]